MQPFAWHVGVDQGPREHFVVVLDAAGKVAGARSFRHSGSGVLELVDWLGEKVQGEWESTAVGTETPWGGVVDSLLLRGAAVFSLNPKQLDRFRDRFSVAGSKDDPRDAHVLGDALRHDRHHFQRVHRPDPGRLELRELRRLRDQVHTDFVRAANHLRARLSEVWPALLELSPAADERWLWALLKRASLPERARRLRRRTLETLLREHRIRRFDADALQAVLREPSLERAPGLGDVMDFHLELLLPRLYQLDEHRRRCEARLAELLRQEEATVDAEEPALATVVASHPGIGTLTAASLLGEAGDQLHDYPRLRILAGTAPVSKISGRTRLVRRRRACNPRLSSAVHLWVEAARKNHPPIQARYARLRARGHTHGRALRQLGDSLLRVLAATVRDRTLYDPNHRRSTAEAI